jgi:hypothetical protein
MWRRVISHSSANSIKALPSILSISYMRYFFYGIVPFSWKCLPELLCSCQPHLCIVFACVFACSCDAKWWRIMRVRNESVLCVQASTDKIQIGQEPTSNVLYRYSMQISHKRTSYSCTGTAWESVMNERVIWVPVRYANRSWNERVIRVPVRRDNPASP